MKKIVTSLVILSCLSLTSCCMFFAKSPAGMKHYANRLAEDTEKVTLQMSDYIDTLTAELERKGITQEEQKNLQKLNDLMKSDLQDLQAGVITLRDAIQKWQGQISSGNATTPME